jgi:uncharacterized protein (TIGR02265 family)
MPGECKGDFAIQILAFLERHYAPALVEQIWSEAGLPPKPIKDEFYSVGAINRCFGECVERGGKGMTLDELNYRSGEEGWLAFANSMVGRIGIALFARRPKRLASRAPNYHTTNNDFGSCRFVDTGPDSYRLEYRDMLSSPYYYHGLYDAATRQLSRGKVSLRVLKFEQAPDYAILADFDIAVEMPKT